MAAWLGMKRAVLPTFGSEALAGSLGAVKAAAFAALKESP